MSFTNRPLAGRSIIVIEGADFLAGYVGDGIRAAGGEVLGHARSAAEADALIRDLPTRPDAAIVDVEIFDAADFPHREKFAELGVPLLLISDRPRTPSIGHDCLISPFAAYQVVDHICFKLGLEPTQA